MLVFNLLISIAVSDMQFTAHFNPMSGNLMVNRITQVTVAD